MTRLIKQGFTLIEMAITIAVIVIVSVVAYANYNEINDTGEILTVSDKLREQVRLAQNFSINGKQIKGKTANGWGVYFNRTTNKYAIYADLNHNQRYDYPTKLLLHGTETFSGNTTSDGSILARTVYKSGNPGQNLSSNDQLGGKGFYSFDGSSDYLKAVTDDLQLGAEDFTIDLWLKYSATGQKRYLLSSNNGAQLEYELFKDTDDKLKFLFYESSSANVYMVSSTEAVSTDNWHHLAVTRTGGFLNMFVDGAATGLTEIGTTTIMAYVTGGSTFIGSKDSVSTDRWSGQIDEIRIAKGWANWFESFTRPTVAYGPDEEKYREYKLPPGVVFQRLYKGADSVNELHVYFSPTDYWMYANNNAGQDEARIVINRAGMENTGLSGDTPRTFKIWPSGLIGVSQ